MKGPYFRRDGHLSELGFEELLAEEGAAAAELQAHLDSCPACQAAFAELKAALPETEGVFAPPPQLKAAARGSEPMPFWRTMPRLRFAAIACAVAAAIVLCLQLSLQLIQGPLQQDPRISPRADDEWRLKGQGFEVQVYEKLDEGVRQLAREDRVKSSAHLGFAVRSRVDGHLLIVGKDDQGHVYPVFPQSQPSTQHIAASEQLLDLRTAIGLDGKAGQEQLFALLCPKPRSLQTSVDELKQAADAESLRGLWPECRQIRYRITKELP